MLASQPAFGLVAAATSTVDRIVLAGLGIIEYLLCRRLAGRLELDASGRMAGPARAGSTLTTSIVAREVCCMSDRIEFSRTDDGWLVARPSSSRFNMIAGQLTSDIVDYAPDCLELLHVMDEVRSGGSYFSQSDLRLHFGLGQSEKASLEIHWPSGLVEKIEIVAANQILRVVEGEGAP